MRFEGIVKSWNEERGFGFIEPAQGGQEIFVHITALPARAGRPSLKQRVSFEVELNREGKKRAKNVQPVTPARTPRSRPRNTAAQWGGASLFVIPAFAMLFLAVATQWRVPRIVAGAYLGLSVACFLAYAVDKSAALKGRWRTKESSLLLLGLLGGWPGGILAQQFLRHKSTKAAFRSAFWGTVAVNVCAFVALSSPWLDAWQRLA
jgi:uncharacterized membrane protein YsdA (DUF1294 family)/cold shock CspA family protein